MPDTPAESGKHRDDVLCARAAEFGVPVLHLPAFEPAASVESLVDLQTVRRQRALPLVARAGRLFVAVADATNVAALDEIKFRTGIETEPVLVAGDQLDAAIERYRPGREALLAEESEDAHAQLHALEALSQLDTERADVDEAPIVKYVQQVLLDAVHAGASDIHFEPYKGFYRIRIRIDGVLRETQRPPPGLSARFAARLKVMARMDIAERRIPQDGRIKLNGADAAVDIRASTLPTLHGEKIVLRILDASAASMTIDQLGFEARQKQHYLNALRRQQGMVLITGPTGSGKTVTLYAGLALLNAEERNIATAEDPVEINVDGINQVQVNPKVGLDFATALRAFLRQDPDVLMVGEIRDLETADAAMKAAQTGHLVLSTLHTNSAAATLTRLRDMGVAAFNVASSVTLIVAQRLARRLCRHCKHPVAVPGATLLEEGFSAAEVDAGLDLFDANENGCDECDRGYSGRTCIVEVVEVAPAIARLILADGDSLALDKQARALGYDSLRRSGLHKVRQGVTSLREINRLTSVAQPAEPEAAESG